MRVPDPLEGGAHNFVCAREDAGGDLMRARHRLSKLLLRHGLVHEGAAWTPAHDAWLRRQRFEDRPLALTFEECYGAVAQAKGRRDSLDPAISELAGEPPPVNRARGVRTRRVGTLPSGAGRRRGSRRTIAKRLREVSELSS